MRDRASATEMDAMTAKVMEHWEAGLTDPEISRAIGCAVSKVRNCRYRLGLASNWFPPITESYQGERMELYRRRLSDAEIARIQGVSSNSIQSWRLHRGLPPNCGVGGRPL